MMDQDLCCCSNEERAGGVVVGKWAGVPRLRARGHPAARGTGQTSWRQVSTADILFPGSTTSPGWDVPSRSAANNYEHPERTNAGRRNDCSFLAFDYCDQDSLPFEVIS